MILIKAESIAGRTIEDTVKSAMAMATQLNCLIGIDINDKYCVFSPNMIYESVIQYFK